MGRLTRPTPLIVPVFKTHIIQLPYVRPGTHAGWSVGVQLPGFFHTYSQLTVRKERTINMKKWALTLMLFAMLAAPVLACGFPLPAGTTMMAVSKAICAQGEAADSCQMRQDAYQMMSKLNAVAVEDLAVKLFIDDGTSSTNDISLGGKYEYVVTDSTDGLGANIHAWLDQGTMLDSTGSQSLDGTEFIIVGTKGYTSTDSGATWTVEDLNDSAMLGLGLLLGLSGPTGSGLDMFTDPAVFTVAVADGPDIDGQAMQMQKLSLDLQSLLGNADALNTLMTDGFSAGGDTLGLTPDTLGVDASQIAMISFMLLPALSGTEFSTTIYIGKDDGYIHRIEDKYVFQMDGSALGLTDDSGNAQKMLMSYELSGNITQHNGDIQIMEPANATSGAGLLSEESGILGGGGLGSSLFGN